MKISIIVPHYNNYEGIVRLIESITTNKFDYEVLIVDDHSEESCFSNLNVYIENLHKQNIILLRNHTDKKGAGVARNIGLDFANGEWLLFADSDDKFVDDAFDILHKYLNYDSEIIYFSPTSTAGNRHIFYENLVKQYLSNQNIESILKIRARFSAPWSKLVKSKLVREQDIKFDEHEVANDIMFSTKCGILAKKITVSSDIIYVISYREGSLTTKKTLSHFLIRYDQFFEYVKYLKDMLSKEEFELLNIRGRSLIKEALFQQKSLKLCIEIIKKLRRQDVKL